MNTKSAYFIEASLVVDGCVSEDHVFDNQEAFDRWFHEIQFCAAGPQLTTSVMWEIYVLIHEHDPHVEGCTCVQFVTDHRPYWSRFIG